MKNTSIIAAAVMLPLAALSLPITGRADIHLSASAYAVAPSNVTFRDAKSNAVISSWKTGEAIKITVTGGEGPYSVVIATSAAGDRGREIGRLSSGQTLTTTPDGSPPRQSSPVSVSVLTRAGYPVATLWRNG